MKPVLKPILILFITGTLVSAQQVSSGEIVDCGGSELDLERLVNVGTGLTLDAGARFSTFGVDTLETFDIELEKKKEKNLYKEIAVVAIIAAMVGYMVIKIIDPGDEEAESEPNGKDIPFGVSVPLTP
jgi:hypothetical protein